MDVRKNRKIQKKKKEEKIMMDADLDALGSVVGTRRKRKRKENKPLNDGHNDRGGNFTSNLSYSTTACGINHTIKIKNILDDNTKDNIKMTMRQILFSINILSPLKD